MKVFVAGASGYVGAAVCRALKQRGHEVVGLAHSKEKLPMLQSLGVTAVLGDLSSDSAVEQAKNVDVIIQCALPNGFYGKRQSRAPHIVAGLVLMIYPYFISNILIMFGIAAVLVLGLSLAVRLGL